MTTGTNDTVVVEANGLVYLCSWCVPLIRSMEIHRLHKTSDGLCPDCSLRLQEEDR
jgi:DNA-directed RNA polymerase subunit RPC12/RpoP